MLRVMMIGALIASTIGCATTQAIDEPIECDTESYRAVLDEIIESDQRYRTQISWGTTDADEIARLKSLPEDEQMAELVRRNKEGVTLDKALEERLWAKQIEIDRANTKRLMRWIEQCGWPSEDRFGEGTPSMVPVLIHMQMEEAEWVLPILRDEVLNGRMPPRPYASIYDRKQQHEGKPQLYGMMQAYDSKTRTVLAPAIHDLDATNSARAEIGMDPIEEYRITDIATAAGR